MILKASLGTAYIDRMLRHMRFMIVPIGRQTAVWSCFAACTGSRLRTQAEKMQVYCGRTFGQPKDSIYLAFRDVPGLMMLHRLFDELLTLVVRRHRPADSQPW